ncbi:hypothetical protein ACGF0J_14205 [Nonomuraea sp. NPDC047897]|uniref:hypothetical protein n=1 Tax=Nonomuraea sp. NPDC047897 TaxID=3364346 RepID=UPI0037161D46
MKKLAILDTETTDLDECTGDMWEIALILRDLRQPLLGDVEYWWQVRPDLTNASPASVQIGRYYERSRVTSANMGWGKRLYPGTGEPGSGWMRAYTGNPLTLGDFYRDERSTYIAEQLARHLDGATVVANNPTHDRKFLAKFLRAHGQILTAHHWMLNVRDLLIGFIDGRLSMAQSIDEAFREDIIPYVADWLEGAATSPSWEIVDVTQDPATKHTALGDARLVRDVYDAIRGSR